LDLQTKVLQLAEGFPIVILTWSGTDMSAPSIVLSSHYDVVPVSESFWECDPFAAVMRDNGDIVARGSQDMKCVGMAYLEAIRNLKETGFTPKQSIHCIFTPDEEVGSANGSELLVKSEEFRALNAGIVLDEGVPVPHDFIQVFNSERVAWCKCASGKFS
jgi:aminoacylase